MKRLFLFAMILFSLSGCDFHSTCDCFDECERAIPFSFCTDSLTSGFRVSEIDTIILYKLPKAQSDPADSIQMYFDPVNKGFYSTTYGRDFCGAYFGFSIDEMGLFRENNFQDFDYLIKIPHLKTYKVSDVVVSGKVSGGNCSCYTNKKKTLKVDGEFFDLSGSSYPEPVKLNR